MKFHGMVGYNPGTNQLRFEWPWPSDLFVLESKESALGCSLNYCATNQRYVIDVWMYVRHGEIDLSWVHRWLVTSRSANLRPVYQGAPPPVMESYGI